MRHVLVVPSTKKWPLDIPGVEVVGGRKYLTDPSFATGAARVYNLAKSYRYQSLGYYVSLLAEARGHRPLPSVHTVEDFKSRSLVRFYSEELDDRIQSSLKPIKASTFTLSIYFARNLAKRYDRLSLDLFNLFPAPLLRADFERDAKDNRWHLRRIGPIAASEIPDSHQSFVVEAAKSYFGKRRRSRRQAQRRYDLAILFDPNEGQTRPSDEKAIKRFVAAAEKVGLEPEIISKEDFGRLGEFDALFIRATTNVKDYTYRFARRAEAAGLVVMDDPTSILRCTNKVYLAELLSRHRIRAPRTMVIHRKNQDKVIETLGLPCVLKQPDGCLSLGVVRADTEEALHREASRLLEHSDLIIGQEFLPTDFDWRVGILDGKPLYVCRYFMAPKHWQVMNHGLGQKAKKHDVEGRTETLAVDQTPAVVLRTALRAASLIGNGLYGVDLKQVGEQCYVVEVNDNPSLDAGCEDAVIGTDLYLTVMRSFVRRLDERRGAAVQKPVPG
jgi:glutathione synthase/RimK-type ligase-like ATP-grasp enzyme